MLKLILQHLLAFTYSFVEKEGSLFSQKNENVEK